MTIVDEEIKYKCDVCEKIGKTGSKLQWYATNDEQDICSDKCFIVWASSLMPTTTDWVHLVVRKVYIENA